MIETREGDGGALAGTKESGVEQGCKEPKRFLGGHSGFCDSASIESRGEASLLVGIAVGDFSGDMVGGKEIVGVAGE